MGIVRTRPEPGHITYGTKLVLVNLTYGQWDSSKLADLVRKAFALAREKNLGEIEVRFEKKTEEICAAMKKLRTFKLMQGTEGRWFSNVKP